MTTPWLRILDTSLGTASAIGGPMAIGGIVISERYEKGFTLLTSTKAPAGQGQVLGDDVLAAASLARLLNHRYRRRNRVAAPESLPSVA